MCTIHYYLWLFPKKSKYLKHYIKVKRKLPKTSYKQTNIILPVCRFDNFQITLTSDGMPVKLQLWDTAGQTGTDRMRKLAYPKVTLAMYNTSPYVCIRTPVYTRAGLY